jgi:hypothetical protein
MLLLSIFWIKLLVNLAKIPTTSVGSNGSGFSETRSRLPEVHPAKPCFEDAATIDYAPL